MTLSQWLDAQQRAHNLATFQLPYMAPPPVKKQRMPHFKPTLRQLEIAAVVLHKQQEEGARSGRS